MAKFTPISYHGSKASKTNTGRARFATQTEASAGTAEDLIISPAVLDEAVDALVEDGTTVVKGIVRLATIAETAAGTSEAIANTPAGLAAIAIAGAPNWSETVSGIGQIATTAEAVAVTLDTVAITPAKIADIFAAPPAIGGTPAAGAFTTLAATGAIDFDAGGSIETGATALNIGADAGVGAINLGTGAAARAITIGNITTTTAVAINSGTNHITLTSTGAGDIITAAGDKLTLDAAGTIDINSSGAAIGIGNDAVSQAINIGTGAAARTITVGNATGASSFVVTAGTGAVNIGVNAIAHTTTIGNKTGASALVLDVGTGNYALNGVGATTYTVGAATTGGTITIGGTAGTGTMTFGDSSGINIVQIGSGEGATTVNIAGGATAAKAVTIATGAVASTVAIGSGSSGAITVDTAAGISLDAATASNFTVTGAADLTLNSTAGSVIITGAEAAANAVEINAVTALGGIDINGGTGGITVDSGGVLSLDSAGATNLTATGIFDITVNSTAGSIIINPEEAAADAIQLTSAAGGLACAVGLGLSLISSEAAQADSVILRASAADGGVDIDSGTGGITIDSTGVLSLDSAGATNLTATGAFDLSLISTAGSIIINAEEAVADAIQVQSAAGGVDLDAALEVNIASSQAASTAITLSASNAAGGITHTGKCIYTPDAITSTSAGVAASVSTVVTEITTNGDSDLDNVTLAAGVDGQLKIFAVVAVGNVADSIKITPASMIGGTQVTFSANPVGKGATFLYDAGAAGWVCVSTQGGTVA